MATSSDRRMGPSGSRSSLVNALIGAVVSVVVSFVPFSPLLGGAVAGYLDADNRGSGLRVGALSGVIAMIPLVLVLGGIVAFLGVGIGIFDPVSGLSLSLVFGAFAIVATLLVGLYTVGLGALGGWVGVELAKRERGRGQPGGQGSYGGQSGPGGAGQLQGGSPGQQGSPGQGQRGTAGESAGEGWSSGGQSGQGGRSGHGGQSTGGSDAPGQSSDEDHWSDHYGDGDDDRRDG